MAVPGADKESAGAMAAESLVDGYSPLIGLRFPASDIPAQARALYTRAPARFVVDRDATPAAVLALPAAGNQSVDLTYAASRALSTSRRRNSRSSSSSIQDENPSSAHTAAEVTSSGRPVFICSIESGLSVPWSIG